MTTPRLQVDLETLTHNSRSLVDRLGQRGLSVTGVVKATLGSPAVARAMLAGGVVGLGDSRVENLERLREDGVDVPLTLTRSPMLGQVGRVVGVAEISLNSEPVVVAALSEAAMSSGRIHGIVLMVELGDLREGLMPADLLDAARVVCALPGVRLRGLGTNLACRSGVVPDQAKMDELSGWVEQVERACAVVLDVVSGGNSASLEWALGRGDVGRITELRLGEAILLGVDPLHRQPIEGLRSDAFTLVAEVIEARRKPAHPWGRIAQAAFGVAAPPIAEGEVNQVVLALGRQDTDPEGLTPPPGIRVLAMSSDHLVLDAGDRALGVGDEVGFGLGYGALLQAMTSPYVGCSLDPSSGVSGEHVDVDVVAVLEDGPVAGAVGGVVVAPSLG